MISTSANGCEAALEVDAAARVIARDVVAERALAA
jgi:hypothetical protein